MSDLKEEAERKSSRILHGINSRAFSEVEKASHIVKGSASFLFCTDLMNAADKLVQLAREGLMLGMEEFAVKKGSSVMSELNGRPFREPKIIWIEIEDSFIELGRCICALNVELTEHFNVDT